MSWFDRSNAKTPERLRDMSPEKLMELLDEGDASKEQLTAIQSELDTRKQTETNLTNELQDTKARLASLEASYSSVNQQQTQVQPSQAQPTDWLENPDQAFVERAAPLADYAMQAASNGAQLRFESDLRDGPGIDMRVYRKYQAEVEKLMSAEPAVRRGYPQVWKNAFTFIKGLHADELVKQSQRGEQAFFSESDDKNNPTETKKTDTELATDSDKKYASKFGVTPEEVVKVKRSFVYDDPMPKENRL